MEEKLEQVRHWQPTQSNGKRKLKLTLSASLLFLSLQDNTSRGCEQSVPSGAVFATAEVWRSPAQVVRLGEPGCCQRGQLLPFRSPLVRVFFKTAILPVPSHTILADRSGASAKTRTRSTRMFHLKIMMCQLKTTSENKGQNGSTDVVCAASSASVFRCFANIGPHALSLPLSISINTCSL